MGIDQISARVSGTSVRVAPGSFNKGIFVQIDSGAGEGEQYQITHPVAMVNGMLRGSFYVTVGESTVITCSQKDGKGKGKEQLRTIIEYKEEVTLFSNVLFMGILGHTKNTFFFPFQFNLALDKWT